MSDNPEFQHRFDEKTLRALASMGRNHPTCYQMLIGAVLRGKTVLLSLKDAQSWHWLRDNGWIDVNGVAHPPLADCIRRNVDPDGSMKKIPDHSDQSTQMDMIGG